MSAKSETVSKRRYMKVMDRVREYVEAEKEKGMSIIRPRSVAEALNVKEPVIAQCFSVLTKEGILGGRNPGNQGFGMGHGGSYCIRVDPPPPPLEPPTIGWGSWQPRKKKPKVGRLKKVLKIIRKTKPWIIEKWCPETDRWWLYVESCSDLRSCVHKICHKMISVNPEDQIDLTRTQLAKWHFDIDGALKTCRDLRRKHPKENFRTRDTQAGDYVMGAILL